jgi:hypothetical protein
LRKVSILIAGKNYDISLEDEFAEIFKADLKELHFKYNGKDIKSFLGYFIEKCHENYTLKKEISKIEKNIKYVIDEQ